MSSLPSGMTTSTMNTTVDQPGKYSLATLFSRSQYANLATWQISLLAPSEYRMLLTISNMDVEHQTDCLYDYVHVSNSSLAHRLCSSESYNNNTNTNNNDRSSSSSSSSNSNNDGNTNANNGGSTNTKLIEDSNSKWGTSIQIGTSVDHGSSGGNKPTNAIKPIYRDLSTTANNININSNNNNNEDNNNNKNSNSNNMTTNVLYILTHFNESMIEFKSDYSISGTGFNFSIRWIEQSLCHQHIQLDESTASVDFQSFNFPFPYPSIMDCSIVLNSIPFGLSSLESNTLVVVFDRILPLQLLDSIYYSTDNGVNVADNGGLVMRKLDSSLYKRDQVPMIVSNSGYVRLTYRFQDLLNGQGFKGHAFAGRSI